MKSLALAAILILAASSLLMVESVSAQSLSTPSFTLEFVDNPYFVQSTTTSTTDPYTGKVTTTTSPGYQAENKTVEVTINNNLGASYYGLRYKGHYSDQWVYYPYYGPDPNSHNIMDGFFPPPFQASNSSYTVGSLYLHLLPQPVPDGAPIDVQVHALFGNFSVTPYVHLVDVGGPTYDAIFKGTAGDWSPTQTVIVGDASSEMPTPTPSVPEFGDLAIVSWSIIVLFVAIVFKRLKY